jgi:hypothetical protein
MIKYGMVTKDSQSDFDSTKKAKYFDAEGFQIADETHKNELVQPVKIQEKLPKVSED